MTLVEIVLALLWTGLTAYALLGGADFGGGFWDLFAGSAARGRATRKLIEHSLGPIWEANHVWLIYAVVLLWTAFPPVFAAITSSLYIPLTLAALGIIGRGAAFAFRKVSAQLWQQRLFGAVFAFSSVVTPFFFGACAGAIASGRVPPGVGQADPMRVWLNPTSAACGVLAVGIAAYLAAVYLTRDAQRQAEPGLAETFALRARVAGVIVGGLAVAGLLVLRWDAPALFRALTSGPGSPLAAVSVIAGLVSLVLLHRRAYLAVRVTAALAVAALLWAWAAGQYPYLLPDTTAAEVSATGPVLTAMVSVLGVGALILAPSMWWLFALFQRDLPARR
ncbi:cytochrome d ubiquinol oxidase subunit II [Allorhizocola rhizosphaerae]|uniref:cytochrome d ubiquinol oxidase subunit II n=1 Tax=Allorhizocola rhizosphaerae TaxID=1872709 RepID=UPI000E3ED853|nr:cytochrome d ubiquinol oxidase subunit II [Allorhizocola rhizosphaerae]